MRGIFAGLSLVLLAGCTSPGPPLPSTTEARSAIEEANAAFSEAFNSKDLDTLVGFYTADAVVLAPNQQAREGQDGVRESFSSAVEVMSRLSLTTVAVEVLSPSTAVERGVYSAQLTPPGREESTQDRGKYVVYWKKDADGSWKIHWEIFNTDLPTAPPEKPEE